MSRASKASSGFAITAAQEAHSKDVSKRMVEYSITMGIRLICLALVFIVPGWWKLVPIIGAVFLPFIAVVFANAGRERNEVYPSELQEHVPRYELDEPADTPDAAHFEVIPGELADQDEPRSAGNSHA